jgi:hypothetical protein
VIRMGYGTYTERIQGNDIYSAAGNPPSATTATAFGVDLSNPGGGIPARFPSNLNAFDPVYNLPQVHQFNLGVERQLAHGAVLAATYVGSKGTYLQSARNINQPLPSQAARVLAGTASVNEVRPFRGYANINLYYNGTNSNYNSLQISLRTDNYHGLTSQTSYTWSHAIDYASFDVGTTRHQNSYRPSLERGNSDFDRRHMLVVGYVYDIPTPGRPSGFWKTWLEGWQISGITAIQTGLPMGISLPGDNAGVGGTVYRPNVVRDPGLGNGTRERTFDPAAFEAPPLGQFGNLGRNVVRQAGLHNWDISLFKNFKRILGRETNNLQLRAEFYNVLNHTQWSSYLTSFGSQGFGSANGARDARSIQLGMKLYF